MSLELKKVFNMKQLLSICYGPSVDREFITDDPHTLWKNGTVKKCDIIIETTKDEMFFSQWTLIISHRDIGFFSEHFEGVLRMALKKCIKKQERCINQNVSRSTLKL